VFVLVWALVFSEALLTVDLLVASVLLCVAVDERVSST
jgi:hypothetical protein